MSYFLMVLVLLDIESNLELASLCIVEAKEQQRYCTRSIIKELKHSEEAAYLNEV